MIINNRSSPLLSFLIPAVLIALVVITTVHAFMIVKVGDDNTFIDGVRTTMSFKLESDLSSSSRLVWVVQPLEVEPTLHMLSFNSQGKGYAILDPGFAHPVEWSSDDTTPAFWLNSASTHVKCWLDSNQEENVGEIKQTRHPMIGGILLDEPFDSFKVVFYPGTDLPSGSQITCYLQPIYASGVLKYQITGQLDPYGNEIPTEYTIVTVKPNRSTVHVGDMSKGDIFPLIHLPIKIENALPYSVYSVEFFYSQSVSSGSDLIEYWTQSAIGMAPENQPDNSWVCTGGSARVFVIPNGIFITVYDTVTGTLECNISMDAALNARYRAYTLVSTPRQSFKTWVSVGYRFHEKQLTSFWFKSKYLIEAFTRTGCRWSKELNAVTCIFYSVDSAWDTIKFVPSSPDDTHNPHEIIKGLPSPYQEYKKDKITVDNSYWFELTKTSTRWLESIIFYYPQDDKNRYTYDLIYTGLKCVLSESGGCNFEPIEGKIPNIFERLPNVVYDVSRYINFDQRTHHVDFKQYLHEDGTVYMQGTPQYLTVSPIEIVDDRYLTGLSNIDTITCKSWLTKKDDSEEIKQTKYREGSQEMTRKDLENIPLFSVEYGPEHELHMTYDDVINISCALTYNIIEFDPKLDVDPRYGYFIKWNNNRSIEKSTYDSTVSGGRDNGIDYFVVLKIVTTELPTKGQLVEKIKDDARQNSELSKQCVKGVASLTLDDVLVLNTLQQVPKSGKGDMNDPIKGSSMSSSSSRIYASYVAILSSYDNLDDLSQDCFSSDLFPFFSRPNSLVYIDPLYKSLPGSEEFAVVELGGKCSYSHQCKGLFPNCFKGQCQLLISGAWEMSLTPQMEFENFIGQDEDTGSEIDDDDDDTIDNNNNDDDESNSVSFHFINRCFIVISIGIIMISNIV